MPKITVNQLALRQNIINLFMLRLLRWIRLTWSASGCGFACTSPSNYQWKTTSWQTRKQLYIHHLRKIIISIVSLKLVTSGLRTEGLNFAASDKHQWERQKKESNNNPVVSSTNRILSKQELRQASVTAHVARQTSHTDVTRQNTARQHDNGVNADPDW